MSEAERAVRAEIFERIMAEAQAIRTWTEPLLSRAVVAGHIEEIAFKILRPQG